jgi:hypothetical protein
MLNCVKDEDGESEEEIPIPRKRGAGKASGGDKVDPGECKQQ